jgi:hypothetical protein
MRQFPIITLAALMSAGLAFGAHAGSQKATSNIVIAKKGADDGAGHNARDRRGKAADGVNHTALETAPVVVARRGADDPAGHDANDDRGGGRHGADDGANHG